MDDMNAFEHQVAREVVREAGPEPRFDALAISRSVRSQSPRWGFRSMLSATKFVAAGVVVALFGGLLLAGVLTQPDGDVRPAAVSSASPSASPARPFSLPAELPDGIESGTLDTPEGPVRWVHVAGTSDTLPIHGDTMPWPTGIAIFDEGQGFGPRRLWVSSDGINWEQHPLPEENLVYDSFLAYDDSMYWLGTGTPRGGNRLMRSVEGQSWDEIDVTAVPPIFVPPVTTGDLTLGVATYREDGGGGPDDRAVPQIVFIIEDGAATTVEVPWGDDPVQLFAADGLIYAFVQSVEDSGFASWASTWRTDDGQEWTAVAAPSFLDASDARTWGEVTTQPGSLVVHLDRGPGQESAAWETTNGVDWMASPSDLPARTALGASGFAGPRRLDSGWYASGGLGGGAVTGENWWMHAGDTWVSLAGLGLRRPEPWCRVGMGSVGDVVLLTARDDCDGELSSSQVDVWILTTTGKSSNADPTDQMPAGTHPVASPQEDDVKLRTPIATAMAVSLLAISAASVEAQDNDGGGALSPMAFTGSVTRYETLADGTESESAGTTHLRGEVETAYIEVSDPRLTGDMVVTSNSVELQPPAARAGRLFSEVYEITNEGGRWVGTGSGWDYEDIRTSTRTILLSGADAYEGLTAYVIIDQEGVAEVEGAIVPSDWMPPSPSSVDGASS